DRVVAARTTPAASAPPAAADSRTTREPTRNTSKPAPAASLPREIGDHRLVRARARRKRHVAELLGRARARHPAVRLRTRQHHQPRVRATPLHQAPTARKRYVRRLRTREKRPEIDGLLEHWAILLRLERLRRRATSCEQHDHERPHGHVTVIAANAGS